MLYTPHPFVEQMKCLGENQAKSPLPETAGSDSQSGLELQPVSWSSFFSFGLVLFVCLFKMLLGGL